VLNAAGRFFAGRFAAVGDGATGKKVVSASHYVAGGLLP
jgi:hypothetical protein